MFGALGFGRGRKARDSGPYEKLSVEEHSEDEQHQCSERCPHSRRWSYIKHVLIHVAVLCVLSVTIGSWLYAAQAGGQQEPELGVLCAHGFHVLVIFEEATYDYQPYDDREWFSDRQLKQKLDEEELRQLREGELEMAYTPFFHNEHCAYCWRKLAIAVERRLPMIDSKTANLHHSTHCAHLLMKEAYDMGTHNTEEYYHQVTFSPLMFQTCVPLSWA